MSYIIYSALLQDLQPALAPTYLVTRVPALGALCHRRDPDIFEVEAVLTDGFVVVSDSVERPYDCVELQGEGEKASVLALTCGGATTCPRGTTCLQKCCRPGQVLVHKVGDSRKPFDCIATTDRLWTPMNHADRLCENVEIRTSYFYEKRELTLCYTNKSDYVFGKDGTLFNHENGTRSYCIDNLLDKEDDQVSEVVLTLPSKCYKYEEKTVVEEKLTISVPIKTLYTVCAAISLFFLVLTFLTYWFIPSYHNLAGKVVLINVIFSVLLCVIILQSYYTETYHFQLNCVHSKVSSGKKSDQTFYCEEENNETTLTEQKRRLAFDRNQSLTGTKDGGGTEAVARMCVFFRSYACSLLGYLGYFTFISTFSWMTIMGLDLCWRLLSYDAPGQDDDTKYGFLLHLILSIVLPLLQLLLLLLLDHLDWPGSGSSRAATSTSITCLAGILLLLADLLWTLSRHDAPFLTSENSKLRIYLTTGIGVPLLLTATVAVLEAKAPSQSIFNPQIGQTRCFLSRHGNRTLLLLDLPLFIIALVNVVILLIIIRTVFKVRRNASNR